MRSLEVSMRGHIAKKGTRYYAVVYEGVDSATQKQRHRWLAAGQTRKDAERLPAELVEQHDGDYRAPERISLGAYLVERRPRNDMAAGPRRRRALALGRRACSRGSTLSDGCSGLRTGEVAYGNAT